MLIQSTIRATMRLAIGIGLAACAAADDPARPVPLISDSIGIAITETSEPASAIAIPATLEPISPAETPLPAAPLPDLGLAPDFTNETWLNSDQPLNLASLQGKVVLVEFWTFG